MLNINYLIYFYPLLLVRDIYIFFFQKTFIKFIEFLEILFINNKIR